MRPVLTVSLLALVASVGIAAYQFVPGRASKPRQPVPVIMADPAPYRVIPLSARDGKVIPVPETVARAPAASVPLPTAAAEVASKPDVLASVAQTLEVMREGEAAPQPEPRHVAAAAGSLVPGQEEAFRQLATRRRVRPVTKMSFPLEAGAEVPAQVYLHPAPPEAANLASGPLGFVMVGDRVVVVAADTRKVVAVSGSGELTSN